MQIPAGVGAASQHMPAGAGQKPGDQGAAQSSNTADADRNQHAFERSMQQQAAGSGANGQAGGGSGAEQVAPAGDPGQAAGAPGAKPDDGASAATSATATHGDRILQAMQKGRAEYRAAVDHVDHAATAGQQMSPADLVRMQMQVARVTLNESLAGQVGSKVDSDIETLLKG